MLEVKVIVWLAVTGACAYAIVRGLRRVSAFLEDEIIKK